MSNQCEKCGNKDYQPCACEERKMKTETIEAWAVIKHGNLDWVFNTEEKAKEQNKLSNGTVVRLTGELPRELNVEDDFVKVTVDGVDYYDSKNELPHQECLALAATHGLRVLERWELCKLFDTSEAFRKSLEHKVYWSASVNSDYRGNAWRFYGSYGNVSSFSRYNTNSVRCVGGE